MKTKYEIYEVCDDILSGYYNAKVLSKVDFKDGYEGAYNSEEQAIQFLREFGEPYKDYTILKTYSNEKED